MAISSLLKKFSCLLVVETFCNVTCGGTFSPGTVNNPAGTVTKHNYKRPNHDDVGVTETEGDLSVDSAAGADQSVEVYNSPSSFFLP